MSTPSRPPLRTQPRSSVLPSPVVLLSVVAVLLAAVAFVVTRGEPTGEATVAAPVVQGEETDPPEPSATPNDEPTREPKDRKPPVRRGETSVVVFNNSGISGLAAGVAAQAGEAGWDVVATDNWYGTIPENTVYYPDDLRREARQLALDLGISRTNGAVEPMQFDRLTVILTSGL